MEKQPYHFIGIGGIGMSALARILLDKKIAVSGSDVSLNANTADLKERGALIYQGQQESHVPKGSFVVYNSSIKQTNPELQAARALGCPMIHRSELLASLMGKEGALAVSGTHGKTTTSSLLAYVLEVAGLDPSYAIGGMFGNQNGKLGKGKYFVAESDESDGSFLRYFPEGCIVTNIECEHMDHYKTKEALHASFATFFSQVNNESLLFYCKDDPVLKKLAARGVSYGFDKSADCRILNFFQNGWRNYLDISFKGRLYKNIELALPGKHNALNAAAVFGLCLNLNIDEASIRRGLEQFSGLQRRLQKIRDKSGVLFIDDYAHHPTEIKKTLESVKFAVEERRLVVIFQPHRYSRTFLHLKEFSESFDLADQVFITDIYAAGEEPIEDISAKALVKKIKEVSTVPCEYLPLEGRQSTLSEFIKVHDVVLTMGAGDIYRLHELNLEIKKLRLGLFFGGLSCEHEISLRSAKFVYDSLDETIYETACFGIDKKGQWICGKEAVDILETKESVDSLNCRPLLESDVFNELKACDVFLPILHGTYGEDGTIQGFFEMLQKAYIGPDYRSAAICMDKMMTKRLVSTAGVNVPKDLGFGVVKWQQNKEGLMEEIVSSMRLPVYVKPVHLGSSVGIKRVSEKEDLESAIDQAFKFDTTVMIEEALLDCRELEFALIGNSEGYNVIAPKPGEKLALGEFVDYDKKYGSQSVATTLEPNLDQDILQKGKDLALKAYRAVGCSGMTRVDFLLDGKGEFWFFEMNPIPGLQKLSLFPKIWNREGVPAGPLFSKLVVLAMHRKRLQDRHFNPL